MGLADILEKGGPVVWVLGAYSVIALAIVLERYFHFMMMGRLSSEVDEKLCDVARNSHNSSTQITAVEELKGPETAVIREMLNAAFEGVEDIGRVASRVGSEELRRMERGLRTLAFLGNTAPLLGLFGTITGMIKAFMVIEKAGGKVDAQALAGGIWEAMVTTGIGLAVAIPILFMLHMIEGMADRRAGLMKRYASMVLERLSHDNVGSSGRIPEDRVQHREGTMNGI